MKKPGLVLLAIVAVVVGFFAMPVGFSIDVRNDIARKLFMSGKPGWAKRIYRFSDWQNDGVATNNLGVLGIIQPDQSNWKTQSDGYKRLERAAGQGLLTAQFNLVMYDFSGVTLNRQRKQVLARLQKVSDAGDTQAKQLMAKKDNPYDMLKELIKLGDANAAQDYSTEMQQKGKTQEWVSALRMMAEAGRVPAMERLGWVLGTGPEAISWVQKAANLGRLSSAYILGRCHADKIYFCSKIDSKKAASWFGKILAAPYIDKKITYPPMMYFTTKNEMRLGYPAMTVLPKLETKTNAAIELAKLYVLGEGVKQDFTKARDLLERHLPARVKKYSKLYQHLKVHGTPEAETALFAPSFFTNTLNAKSRATRAKLRPLLEKKLIRTMSLVDVQAVRQISGFPIDHELVGKLIPSLDRLFLVTGAFELPQGMWGGGSVVFVVPHDVPVPNGKRGHNRFLMMPAPQPN